MFAHLLPTPTSPNAAQIPTLNPTHGNTPTHETTPPPTNKKPHSSRREARARAAQHLANGNVAAALECYQRAVDVTPSMAKRVCDALSEIGVSFLVAPYEADAQMAYLARRGDVGAVVTEDSDLLAYACPK